MKKMILLFFYFSKTALAYNFDKLEIFELSLLAVRGTAINGLGSLVLVNEMFHLLLLFPLGVNHRLLRLLIHATPMYEVMV